MDDGEKTLGVGRTYLFQIPPRVPTLYHPLDPKPLPPGVKPKIEEDDEVQLTATKVGAKDPIDLTKEKKKVKFTEEKVTVIKEEEGAEKHQSMHVKEQYVNQEGYVGRLIVRRSGRMEVVWGNDGPPMVVKSGIRTNFLSVSAVVQHPEVDNNEGAQNGGGDGEQGGLGGGPRAPPAPRVRGVASGMGEIMGKFVVTPDFEKMLG